MCGRFSFHLTDLGAVAAAFGIRVPEGLVWTPRYNIAPTQDAPVVTGGAQPALQLLRWGLVPHWAKDASIGHRAINARIETAGEKPSFRDAVQRRRCIVPATGYFEWKRIGPRDRQPMWVHPGDTQVMWLAGLWARRHGEAGEQPLQTFSILTCPAEGEVAAVHDRMPVELSLQGARDWLLAGLDGAQAIALARRAARGTGHLAITPVSNAVNSPRNDDPRCIEEAPARGAPQRTQLSFEDLVGGPADEVDGPGGA